MIPKYYHWIATLPALSGLLLGLSFPPLDWHGLAWIALVPLACCWTQSQLPRSAYWSAFVGGVVFYLLALGWIRYCYLEGQGEFGPYTDGWIFISLLNGLFFVGFFAYGRWMLRATRFPVALVLPVAWVTFELLRYHVGALVDQMGFPWGKLAVTQADELMLIQVADLGGEYLVSFIVAMVSGMVVDGWLFWRRRDLEGEPRSGEPLLTGVLVGGGVLIAVFGYGNWRIADNNFQLGPTVCLMSEHDMPEQIDRNQITIDRQSDLLVWPELALKTSLINLSQAEGYPALPLDVAVQVETNLADHVGSVRNRLAAVAHNLNATLLIGCERLEPEPKAWRRYNSVVCVDPQQGLVGCYDKCYPVPWAEFMPYVTDRVDSEDQDNFCRGTEPTQFDIRARAGETVYCCRPVLCYDLCFASFFRKKAPGKTAKDAVNFFVHSGSEGQDRTGVLAETMLRAARFRAIESRRAIVRNVSQGTSGILDGNGQLQVVVPGTVVQQPTWLGAIPIDYRWSFYTYAGDWPMVFVCLIFAIAGKVSVFRLRLVQI